MTRALLLLLPLVLACERAAPSAPVPAEGRRARVTIGVHVIEAELVDTPELQRRGLSGRRELPAGTGMLFVYDAPAPRGFWMPDMHFDIDIVWIRAGRIVHIESDVPHVVQGRLPTYRPSEPADLVLEVAAGTAKRLGWRVGDAVSVDGLSR